MIAFVVGGIVSFKGVTCTPPMSTSDEEAENRERQDDEIEALKSIFGDDAVKVKTGGSQSERRTLEVGVDERARLFVALIPDYPSRSAPDIRLVGSKLSQERANEVIRTCLDEVYTCDDVCIYSVVQYLRERIFTKKVDRSVQEAPFVAPRSVRVSRKFFWTHHTRVKQRLIYEWATELRISGRITVTRPGYLLVEAEERDMIEFSKRNMGEHWKEIRITWEDTETVQCTTVDQEKSIDVNKVVDASRWFRDGLREVSIREFASEIRAIGHAEVLECGTRGAIRG